MTGRRRYSDTAETNWLRLIRFLIAAVVVLAFSNVVAFGCIIAWLGAVPGGAPTALTMFAVAAGSAISAGALAMLAWSWCR